MSDRSDLATVLATVTAASAVVASAIAIDPNLDAPSYRLVMISILGAWAITCAASVLLWLVIRRHASKEISNG